MLTDTVFGQAMAGLTVWALASLGSAVGGLFARPREYWRGFWFMSGLWGLIDGLIAWVSLLRPPPTEAELATLLLYNGGADVAYLAAGGVLATRRNPLVRGFGLAVLVQGGFLLAFDLAFYARCGG